ncbi:MAG: c-type cytochrome [Rhodothermales bacterium]|nr:c-type cytochrome [Rhodothermales bacterium]
MPEMDPVRGRRVFAEKGCVVCHSINGIGGEDATPLDATTMSPMMNPFEFTAKMWRGAEAMVILQRDELGEQIELTGQDLADIIAFVHSHKEQTEFTEADVPEKIRELIEHGHGEDEKHN